jgi:hypothetical protein
LVTTTAGTGEQNTSSGCHVRDNHRLLSHEADITHQTADRGTAPIPITIRPDLEPAVFWLSEYGLPMAVSTWKGLFGDANIRCRRQGLRLHAFAHLLRHSFAVITLEQLQRGHIAALGELTPDQRGHYTRIFGDPLDWVRRRMGHQSVVTTQIYLHALAELEMETRMALVPDGWEDPRSMPPDLLDDVAPETPA